MSYTEIYKFGKSGDVEMIDETKNAWRGAMAIWGIMESKYLPKYIPTWAMGDTSREYSRTSDFAGNGLKDVWALFNDEKVSLSDKIVLGSTFDKVIVMKEDIEKLVEAFRTFEGETSLNEQADIIEQAFKNDEDLVAICWNQTSVNGDAWSSDRMSVDEEGYEEYLPYNLNVETEHWDLFKDLK